VTPLSPAAGHPQKPPHSQRVAIHGLCRTGGGLPTDQRSLFGLEEQLARISACGDPLETLERTVDFEAFRSRLVAGIGYGDGAEGGRPPFDPVSMLDLLIVQTHRNLSGARAEFMLRDRLSWMRFAGFDLGAPTPDETSIRHFRNRLTDIMGLLNALLREKGFLPMSGQIVDASLVPAPSPRTTDREKAAIKAGKTAREIRPDQPAKAAQKDTNARWTLKIGGKIRYRPDGTPLPQIALPAVGYKTHVSIDRRFGFIREGAVTSAAAEGGRMPPKVIDKANTASDVRADTVYR
jgi:IS5 family transposase